MSSDFWMDKIPIWGLFILTVALVLLSICIGQFFGDRRRRQPDHESESSLGAIVGATLGLLAFMLAFTFGMAAERLGTRKQLLLDEVNAIGTTYLRAGLLLEPHRSEVQKLLREYVDTRASLAKEALSGELSKFNEAVSRSETLQEQIWSRAVAITDADRNSEIDALFIDSLNQMIDLHNSRLTVFNYRIPTLIWYVLYFIAILAMVMVGYQKGLSSKSSVKITIVLALTFSVVIFLIADLDRPIEGTLRVNQKPILELQKKMQAQPQEANPQTSLLVPKDDSPRFTDYIQDSGRLGDCKKYLYNCAESC